MRSKKTNLFNFVSNPNIKRSKTDYGAITINALKRATGNFYTAEELAEKLKLNIITIYRYIRAKKIKAYKFGKEYRIDEESFNEFINKNLIK